MRSRWVIKSVHPNSMNNILHNIHAEEDRLYQPTWLCGLLLQSLHETPLQWLYLGHWRSCVSGYFSPRAHSDGRWARGACMSRLCSALQRNQHDHRRHGYKKRYVYRQFSVSLSFLSDPTPPHAFTCCMRPRERTSLWGHSQQLNTVVGSMADTLRTTLVCWQALVILYCTFFRPCFLYSAGPNTELCFKAHKESADRLPGPHHWLTVWLAI